jgi:hypothetical protein
MNKRMCLLVLGFCCLLTGCAPEIGLTLTAPEISEPENLVEAASSAEPVRVRIGAFVDARPTQTIAIIDGRKVDSEGELGRVVEEGFERYLRSVGARIAVLNAPTIEGQVVDWSARVEPGFPTSEAQAVARLKVTVRDTRAHPIYYATFSGESSVTHPMLGVEEVQQLLAQAMGSAIEAAVRDEDFVSQLSKGRIN